MGAGNEAQFDLAVKSGAVFEPAIELMAMVATEVISDHGS
jgi:hypothetical protein